MTGVFGGVLGCFRMFWDVLGCSKVFFSMFWGVSGWFGCGVRPSLRANVRGLRFCFLH